jgi:O-antigen/teichoic acid export membrane protein
MLIFRQPFLINIDCLNTGKFLIRIIPTSILFMGIQLLAVVLYAAPNILVTYFLDLGSVTYFNVVMKLMYVPLNIISALLPIFWPSFTTAWVNKNISWIRNKILTLSIYTCLILTAFSSTIFIFGKDFIYKWTSGNVSVEQTVLGIAGMWLVVQGCIHWMSTFLHSITDLKFEFLCYIFTVFLFFTIGCSVIPNYKILGVLISMLSSIFIGSFVPMTWRLKNKLA